VRQVRVHPIRSLSHLVMRDCSTLILLDTLEPPTMAAKGRAGALIALHRKSSSCTEDMDKHSEPSFDAQFIHVRFQLLGSCDCMQRCPCQACRAHLLHEESGHCRLQESCNACCGCMGAMCAAECVVDVDVSRCSQLQQQA
jgi:hypothetical protein